MKAAPAADSWRSAVRFIWPEQLWLASLLPLLVFEKKETEVTALFAYLAGLLMLAAATLSSWWFGRLT
jgi:hypothetical protein